MHCIAIGLKVVIFHEVVIFFKKECLFKDSIWFFLPLS